MDQHSCCGTTPWPQHTSACMSQIFSVIHFFFLWDKLWSHITGKPVTDAIKHADAQLHAFNVPKAEFPWRGCKHLSRRANQKSFGGVYRRIKSFHWWKCKRQKEESNGSCLPQRSAVSPHNLFLVVSTFWRRLQQKMTTNSGKLRLRLNCRFSVLSLLGGHDS